jgi:hypothetical protein
LKVPVTLVTTVMQSPLPTKWVDDQLIVISAFWDAAPQRLVRV